MSTVETELKFDAPKQTPDADIPDVDGFTTLSTRGVELTAVYWDTDDRSLLAWGLTLRHRSASDGSEDGWTLKLPTPGSRDDGAVVRTEVDADGDGEQPPAELTALLGTIIDGSELGPVATVTTSRQVRSLSRDAVLASVELVDDTVTSRLGDTEDESEGPSFRQIEAELVDVGDQDTLTLISEGLSAAGFTPSNHDSKLARVLGGRPPLPLPDGRTGRHASIADFVVAMITSSARQLIAEDPAVRLGDDAEAIHRARVATRRLRSDLRTFRPLLDRDRVQALRVELKWFGALLGDVRDPQVLEHRLIDAAPSRSAGPAERAELTRRLGERGDLHRTMLQNAMTGDRYRSLVADLTGLAQNPPLRDGSDGSQHADTAIGRLAAKEWKRVGRTANKLADESTDHDLHEFRKEIKKARYAFQGARRIKVGTKGASKQLGELQDQLGDLMDSVVAMEWLAAEAEHLSPSAAFLAGQLHHAADDRRREIRRTWRGTWDQLEELDPFG